jgi:hypothetical protein
MKTLQATSTNTLSEISDNTTEDIGCHSNANAKWPIKEKLYLISFVLVHGDSDWPFIASQLNKWISTAHSNNTKSTNPSATTTNLNANKKTMAVRSFLS